MEGDQGADVPYPGVTRASAKELKLESGERNAHA
jgi:hypothetical protein